MLTRFKLYEIRDRVNVEIAYSILSMALHVNCIMLKREPHANAFTIFL